MHERLFSHFELVYVPNNTMTFACNMLLFANEWRSRSPTLIVNQLSKLPSLLPPQLEMHRHFYKPSSSWKRLSSHLINRSTIANHFETWNLKSEACSKFEQNGGGLFTELSLSVNKNASAVCRALLCACMHSIQRNWLAGEKLKTQAIILFAVSRQNDMFCPRSSKSQGWSTIML